MDQLSGKESSFMQELGELKHRLVPILSLCKVSSKDSILALLIGEHSLLLMGA